MEEKQKGNVIRFPVERTARRPATGAKRVFHKGKAIGWLMPPIRGE